MAVASTVVPRSVRIRFWLLRAAKWLVPADRCLILPLAEIGAVLHDLVRGGELPRSPEERASVERLFSGGDEVSALYRSMDWRNTSLGPVIGWPQELSAVATTAGRAECRRCRDFWC